MTRFIVDREQVEWRELAGQTVVLHLPTSRFVELNVSAAALWERVVDGATAEELVRLLRDRYGIEEQTAASDVQSFLEALSETDLLGTCD